MEETIKTAVVKLLLFCKISISKNRNDPLISFLLVNLILIYFVFKYSLNFLRLCGDRYRTNISSTYNTQA